MTGFDRVTKLAGDIDIIFSYLHENLLTAGAYQSHRNIIVVYDRFAHLTINLTRIDQVDIASCVVTSAYIIAASIQLMKSEINWRFAHKNAIRESLGFRKMSTLLLHI